MASFTVCINVSVASRALGLLGCYLMGVLSVRSVQHSKESGRIILCPLLRDVIISLADNLVVVREVEFASCLWADVTHRAPETFWVVNIVVRAHHQRCGRYEFFTTRTTGPETSANKK